MRINTRFPVAVHVLCALAYFEKGAVPSELVAKSVGTNPVVVRRVISLLKRAGLVDARPGVKGAVLRREPKDISLLEIYNAVRPGAGDLFDIHPNPCPECDVGAYFADAVRKPLANAQRALEKELSASTLSDVLETIERGNRRKRR